MSAQTTPTDQSTTISVGAYIAARLQELHVAHLFGLPGDFNLALLDEMLDSGDLEWVGSTNELNAAYAADGYARERGVGVVVTTYGVGELSAVNGIAGAAAESVPVLHVVGAPSRAAGEARSLLHHTLGDGDGDRFERMSREIVCAAETLDPERAPEQIDHVLERMLHAMQPGYLRVPADVATAEVSSHGLETPLAAHATSDPEQMRAFAAHAGPLVSAAPPLMLVGRGAQRHRVGEDLRRLGIRGARLAVMADAVGSLPAGTPGALGLYMGALTDDADVRAAVENADLLVTVGTRLTDLVTGMFTHRLGSGSVISLADEETTIDGTSYPGVTLPDALDAISDHLGATEERPDTASASGVAPVPDHRPHPSGDAALTQEGLWQRLSLAIGPGTPVVADAGTAFYGALRMRLPEGARLIGQPTWSSIGYALPAAIGLCIAGSARPLLLIGDGAAQLTIQELSTVQRSPLAPVVVIIDNSGYTVERAIRSPDAAYQDVTRWDWPRLAHALVPGERCTSDLVRTGDELTAALQAAASDPHALAVIVAVLPRDDSPALLRELAAGLGAPAVHTTV